MQTVYFATTNRGKLEEAKEILGIGVIGTPLEVNEIQSLDPVKVASEKAKEYFKELKKPLFVEDVSLTFNALGNLPGTYINDFIKELGNEGLIDLLKGKDDRSAVAQVVVVYVSEKGEEFVFLGEVKGSISTEERGGSGFGWDPIFIPEGSDKTFAEMDMDEKNEYSMRAKALTSFKKWFDINYKI